MEAARFLKENVREAAPPGWKTVPHLWGQRIPGTGGNAGAYKDPGAPSGTPGGYLKKGRMEPAHALALFLKKEDVFQWTELGTGETAAKYLRGEAIGAGELEAVSGGILKGWVLMTVDGFSLGFAKADRGVLEKSLSQGLKEAVGRTGSAPGREKEGSSCPGNRQAISSGSGAEVQDLSRERMGKGKSDRMQGLAADVPEVRIVEKVPGKGMADIFHMDTDLVGARPVSRRRRRSDRSVFLLYRSRSYRVAAASPWSGSGIRSMAEPSFRPMGTETVPQASVFPQTAARYSRQISRRSTWPERREELSPFFASRRRPGACLYPDG